MVVAKKAPIKKKVTPTAKQQEARLKTAVDHPRHPDAEVTALALLVRLGLGGVGITVTQEQLDAVKGRRLIVQQISSNETLVSIE